MSIYKAFGERLSELRQGKKLSQAELASKFNMPQSTYSGYESGKRKIGLDLIESFAEFFGVSPTYLITGKTLITHDKLNVKEQEHIKKYRALDQRGKDTVDNLLNFEYSLQSNKTGNEEILTGDAEIDKELRNYHLELVAEKGGDKHHTVSKKEEQKA